MSNENIIKLREKLKKLGVKAEKESRTGEVVILKVIMQQKAMIYFEISNALAEIVLDD